MTRGGSRIRHHSRAQLLRDLGEPLRFFLQLDDAHHRGVADVRELAAVLERRIVNGR
jgi:D-serine deaminase-like pyridoxal phosphate-dependent protein